MKLTQKSGLGTSKLAKLLTIVGLVAAVAGCTTYGSIEKTNSNVEKPTPPMNPDTMATSATRAATWPD